MPNWCMNQVEIKTTNLDLLAKLEAFEQGAESAGLFSVFAPMPPELLDAPYPNTPEDVAARNIEQFGFATWYDFAEANWGTKWDVQRKDVKLFLSDGVLHLTFDTAWAPPINLLTQLGGIEDTTLTAYYYEPGNSFAGVYDSVTGEDNTLDLLAEDFNKPDRAPILDKLDDLFGISLDFEDMEDDED